MDTLKANAAGLEAIKDLKPILSAKGPCVSVYMPLAVSPIGQAGNVSALQWRELMAGLENQVAIWGAEGRQLLDSISNFQALASEASVSGKSIAVLRSADVFRVTSLQSEVPAKAVLGNELWIRPLLLELTVGRSFYLLALSQNDVRLLHCTTSSSEEIPIGRGSATSFDAYMNSAKPDHARVNGASAGSSAGSARTVVGTTNTERETKEEYLTHFFQQIDRGVTESLKGHTEPLVTVGVDYELSLYKTVNSYSNLIEEGVQGAPNSLKSGEMHARALLALRRDYDSRVDDVLAEYDHKVGGGASNRLKDVVTAAHDGRVLTLVVSDSLTTTGSFDEATHEVSGRAKGAGNDQDLVNDAAIQTILHAGNVFVAGNHKMPHGSPVAAIFRY